MTVANAAPAPTSAREKQAPSNVCACAKPKAPIALKKMASAPNKRKPYLSSKGPANNCTTRYA